MSNQDDDHFNNLVIYGGGFIAVCTFFYFTAERIFMYLLKPTFKFCTWYLTNYGSSTALLIFLCVMTYSACKYHFKSIARLTEIFENETKKNEQAVTELQKIETELREKLSSATQKIGEQSDRLQFLNQEIASLKEQNQILETENKRLRNPVAFNLKQKSKIQKENAENLKASIHQTHWRESK